MATAGLTKCWWSCRRARRWDLIDGAVGEEEYGRDQLEQLPTGPDSLWVRLPRPVEQGQGVVSLRFSGALYLVSNAFEVQVGRGQGADQVWQRVDGGVNTGRGLTVFTPFTKAVLGEVAASSNPFTPNGDGINDVVELVFPVFQVQGAKALILEVYGLDGQSVQRIEAGGRDRRRGSKADLGWAGPTGSAAAAGTVFVSASAWKWTPKASKPTSNQTRR